MTAENCSSTPSEREMLGMAEALVLSGSTVQRAKLVGVVKEAGVLATATDEPGRALKLARQKHFTVIILDADTPSPGAGIDSIEQFRKASPASTVILSCCEASYEHAVGAFRRGATDVVALREADYLKDRVVGLCVESSRKEQRDRLLLSTLELHDQFLRRLMDAHRRALEAEEAAAGQDGSEGPCVILVVDDNPRTAPGLERALEPGFRCVCATNGGEALDYASNRSFDIALVKESLPDLSGGMVARTLRAQSEGGIVLLFEHPGDTPGFASIIEGDQSIELVRELERAPQLVDRIRELHQAYAAKRREKRHVRSFRRTNTEFLKSYVQVRQQILALLPEGDR